MIVRVAKHLIAACLVFAWPSVGLAAKWEVAGAARNGMMFFVDSSSIQPVQFPKPPHGQPQSYVEAWTQTVDVNTRMLLQKVLMVFDCHGRYTVVSGLSYDGGTRVSDSMDITAMADADGLEPYLRAIAPDTIADDLEARVCQGTPSRLLSPH